MFQSCNPCFGGGSTGGSSIGSRNDDYLIGVVPSTAVSSLSLSSSSTNTNTTSNLRNRNKNAVAIQSALQWLRNLNQTTTTTTTTTETTTASKRNLIPTKKKQKTKIGTKIEEEEEQEEEHDDKAVVVPGLVQIDINDDNDNDDDVTMDQFAKAMNQLSVKERDEAYDDLHGIVSSSSLVSSSPSSNIINNNNYSNMTNKSTSNNNRMIQSQQPQQQHHKLINDNHKDAKADANDDGISSPPTPTQDEYQIQLEQFYSEVQRLSSSTSSTNSSDPTSTNSTSASNTTTNTLGTGYHLACQLEREQQQQQNESTSSTTTTSSYVHKESLIHSFLHANRYHPTIAAQRYLQYWNWKLQLFGPSSSDSSSSDSSTTTNQKKNHPILLQDITLQQLSILEISIIESGFLQLVNGTDRSGRSIICYIRNLMKLNYITIQQRCRIIFYFIMSSILQNLSIQQQSKGIVIIYYLLDLKLNNTNNTTTNTNHNDTTTTKLDTSASWNIPKLFSSLPILIVAQHACLNHTQIYYIILWSSKFLDRYTLVRSRCHFGSHIECQYALMSYGISNKILPMTSNGIYDLQNHFHWLHQQWNIEKQQQQQQQNSTTSSIQNHNNEPKQKVEVIVVDHPNPYDVLFGKGRAIQNRQGNIRYRNLIDIHMKSYNTSSKLQKRTVCQQIIQAIHDSGGRFLKQQQQQQQWVIVDSEAALDKVAHGFRNKRLSLGQSKTIPILETAVTKALNSTTTTTNAINTINTNFNNNNNNNNNRCGADLEFTTKQSSQQQPIFSNIPQLFGFPSKSSFFTTTPNPTSTTTTTTTKTFLKDDSTSTSSRTSMDGSSSTPNKRARVW